MINETAAIRQLARAKSRFLLWSPGAIEDVRVFYAPGRVNLIGEHTDYNGGYVLPAALDLGTWAFVRTRGDGVIRFASTSFAKIVETPVEQMVYRQADDYANYPKGVICEFQKRGFAVPGFDVLFHGNLPNGAGLSSSASIEVVTAALVNALVRANLSFEDMALVSQAAENQFVGVNCGIMDQFAVAMGKQNHAISLNCHTLHYQLVPVSLDRVTLVIANTNKRRTLADSKYNARRSECEQALRELQKIRPALRTLADIGDEWPEIEPYLTDTTLKKRARHVVLENQRAKRAVEVLRAGDTQRFGEMMNASHQSLRDDYEVTGPELDALVEAAWSVEGCIGSRMTGAGFGGCTVSLVSTDSLEEFMAVVKARYVASIGYEPSFYVTGVGDGVQEMTEEVLQCLS
ncbi:galactokinase [Alicyclobacillus acidiphilus]|uniref:galactokinase n=1 Tax=Alicyclobacillus acidiphilus TaxID=182455 RepID=UPI000A58CA01